MKNLLNKTEDKANTRFRLLGEFYTERNKL